MVVVRWIRFRIFRTDLWCTTLRPFLPTPSGNYATFLFNKWFTTFHANWWCTTAWFKFSATGFCPIISVVSRNQAFREEGGEFPEVSIRIQMHRATDLRKVGLSEPLGHIAIGLHQITFAPLLCISI